MVDVDDDEEPHDGDDDAWQARAFEDGFDLGERLAEMQEGFAAEDVEQHHEWMLQEQAEQALVTGIHDLVDGVREELSIGKPSAPRLRTSVRYDAAVREMPADLGDDFSLDIIVGHGPPGEDDHIGVPSPRTALVVALDDLRGATARVQPCGPIRSDARDVPVSLLRTAPIAPMLETAIRRALEAWRSAAITHATAWVHREPSEELDSHLIDRDLQSNSARGRAFEHALGAPYRVSLSVPITLASARAFSRWWEIAVSGGRAGDA